MHSPCMTRRTVNVVKSGRDCQERGRDRKDNRLTRIPSRRSIRWLNKETTSPATAMPIVLELTANPMAAGVTL